MKHAATSESTSAPHHRPDKILAYALGDDGSPIQFDVEWSGRLQRWVIVDAFTGTLVAIHRAMVDGTPESENDAQTSRACPPLAEAATTDMLDG